MRGVIAAIKSGELSGSAKIIISNNRKSSALAYAMENDIPHAVINEQTQGILERVDGAIRDMLLTNDVNLVVLSGYMKKVGPLTRETFPNRILNVHPALLPRHAGLWGDMVHQAVLDSGESTTGVTIHTIDEEYDTGTIIWQSEVSVAPSNSVEQLRKRVQAEEINSFIHILKDIQQGNKGNISI